ncbi:MAG: elongation factor P [Christensenellales bacterium]|jgi:elongation factor P
MQASDLKINTVFVMDGSIYVALDVRHVQQPRLASFLSVKYKNIETGQVFENRFNPGDKLEEANIERREMQYLYQDGNLYYFMDVETYDQIPIDEKVVGETMKLIKEGATVTIHFALGRIIAVVPPLFVELEVVDAEPGLAGDTTRSVLRPAKVETGYEVRIPLFVNVGDIIRIDTRTGEYAERVSK